MQTSVVSVMVSFYENFPMRRVFFLLKGSHFSRVNERSPRIRFRLDDYGVQAWLLCSSCT